MPSDKSPPQDMETQKLKTAAEAEGKEAAGMPRLLEAVQNRKMVAIVGRPNVGKSALFNRLAGKQIAIVHDRPGVTRDRLIASCYKGAAPFDIMDTGGIGEAIEDDFNHQVQAEAQIAVEVADLILFVVDGLMGLTPVDQELANTFRKAHRPVVMVVNKIDTAKPSRYAAEFAE